LGLVGKRFITSGCGRGFSFVSLGDAVGTARLVMDYRVAAQEIPALMKEFLKQSRRPGMHSSAFAKDGKIAFIRQDIGRHNTVDMILGRLWLDNAGNMEDSGGVILTTGRISYEMVVKAAKARIPIVVSHTAATSMAVELARRLGVEVVGYVRGSNMKVYTDGRRLSAGLA
jgi:FdhD protein